MDIHDTDRKNFGILTMWVLYYMIILTINSIMDLENYDHSVMMDIQRSGTLGKKILLAEQVGCDYFSG